MIQGQPVAAAIIGAGAPAAAATAKPGNGAVKPGRGGTNATTSTLGDQLVAVRRP
jgi:hypothetical protein